MSKTTKKRNKKLLWAVVAFLSIVVMSVLGFWFLNRSTRASSVAVVAHVYTPEELLVEANKLRAVKDVAPLKLDSRLEKSARCWANEMKQLNFYGHNYPDGTRGEDRSHCIEKNIGFECQKVSENIDEAAVGYNPFDPVYGWPTSPSHYAAEIDVRYDLTGFAYTEFNGKGYYVQHFCDLK